jgi:predicted P-loop ATPase
MSETKQMTISEQAMAYHANGYAVIPVGQDKRPIISSWKKYQTEQQTDEEVIELFKNNPNVAIITGKISGITVIDIDAKGDEANATAMLARFPATYTVKTPSKGYHLYYQYAEGFTVSANAYPDFPNVDIRGDSGYVVAPPSELPNGKYEVINNTAPVPFPAHLFPKQKPKKSLTEMTTASKGNRDDTLTSFVGKLLQATKEEEWYTEVLPAVERANKTYSPPLSDADVKKVFNSIVAKEKSRRADLIVSPIQMEDGQEIPATAIRLRKNSANQAYKDMANAMIVLETHPYYKNTIRYNTFKQEIEYNGKPLEDSDVIKIQHFMQTEAGLHGIQQGNVFSAIVHYAQKNKYDEAQDWLNSLTWDKTPRLHEWLARSLGLPNDLYLQGVGFQWLNGMVSRIMRPGAQFDYVLMLVGPQNLGKTSFFRIIGGPFYKSYTGPVDNKDFYLALRGAMLLDLDEGATLYRSEAIKIKSIITEVCDEYRAPYDRLMKKYPRRFVFSLSTNDNEPFRDVTGNRRYWAVDITDRVDFKWLEENRDQLFAESYYYFKNKIDIPIVPEDQALAIQEAHLPDDSWTELVVGEVRKSEDYCKGDPNYSTTIMEVFQEVFKDESLIRLDRRHEMRIATIFKKELGLEKSRRMVNGEQKNRWYISEKKLKLLQAKNAAKTVTDLEELADDLKDDEPEQLKF